MSGPEEGISGRLKGWSRRKLEAKRQEVAVQAPPVIPDPAAPEDVTPTPPVDEAEIVAGLPALDEITAGFDMSPFLAKGVPTHLKNAALRKLWSASPAVRDYLDPAVDYAWDWNAPGGVPGGGGVLSEQSVAKMVQDLIGKRPDPAAGEEDSAEAPPDPNPDEAVAELDHPVPAQEETPVAVRHLDAPKTEQNQEKDPARATDHASMLPLRRHGGAVPH